MSSQSIERTIAELAARMRLAAEAEDFELAARLRDQIAELKAPAVRQPPPGQMGLGTNLPVAEPPPGWKRPKRPHPMTANHRPGGRRK
ncbi:MAG TPA: UvrB/UvrC motif-containing protein [Devosia sp.]|nr:UvrB/UvrC motif-containing protein [Devosia sp.]